jgi:hypothetical protein
MELFTIKKYHYKNRQDGYMETSSNLYGDKIMDALSAYNITSSTSLIPLVIARNSLWSRRK